MQRQSRPKHHIRGPEQHANKLLAEELTQFNFLPFVLTDMMQIQPSGLLVKASIRADNRLLSGMDSGTSLRLGLFLAEQMRRKILQPWFMHQFELQVFHAHDC